MVKKQPNTYPIIFLGISAHIKSDGVLPPVTPIDIFRLSRQSAHIIYPISVRGFQWVFLINSQIVKENLDKTINLEVRSQEGKMKISFQMQILPPIPKKNHNKKNGAPQQKASHVGQIAIPENPTWYIQPFHVDAVLELPGTYNVYAGIGKADHLIDQIHFLYHKVPPFTADQIKAIESDIFTSKNVIVEVGCKKCPTKIKAYTSLNRDYKKEKDGYLWQHELPDEFICSCKSTKQNLTYLKEGMHGLLGRYKYLFDENISYERRHSHQGILKILTNFNSFLEKQDDEKFFQKFIEQNPVMLAKYHAKNISFRKDILGKFEADIVILSTDNQLIFLELERPDLQLFKKDGHPTAKLMHAYNQVVDWMDKYKRHPHALLEHLNLKIDDITLVKGVVIAGKNKNSDRKHLRRHYANPIYNNIEFLTYDCLADSLAQISRDLL